MYYDWKYLEIFQTQPGKGACNSILKWHLYISPPDPFRSVKLYVKE